MLFLVAGNKLQTWMAKYYPFIYKMTVESFENNIPVYLITADVFKVPYHVLERDEVELELKVNQSISTGEYFKCYNDKYSYRLVICKGDML